MSEESFDYSSLEWLNLKDELVSLTRLVLTCKKYITEPNTKTLTISQDKVKKLNKELGCDVDKFRNYLQLLERQRSSYSEEFVSVLKNFVEQIDGQCRENIEQQKLLKNTLEGLDSEIKKVKPFADAFSKSLAEINKNQLNKAYRKALRDAIDLSQKVEESLNEEDIEKGIDHYLNLSDIRHVLIESKCVHLSQFLSETIYYWHGILKSNLSAEFNNIMKSIQWPFVASNSLLYVPPADSMKKFQTYVEHLLLTQLPLDVNKKPSVSSSVVVSFPHISLPMHLLVSPLKKRFMYHFTGNKKTNRIDKPEWYFSQILTWIHDHEKFVAKWVQPVYNDLEIKRNATVELMCSLVDVCLEKLQADLEEAQYDDALFSHAVDESLGFHKELTDSFPYPPSLPSTPAVLTQAPIFIKWINMERKYARDKMDAILSSESAWLDASSDDHVTEVAHSFLSLLSAMTDRFSSLPQPGHRLQFVEVELELIDDLRVSMLQILHSERADPLNSKLPQVLNTVHYLHQAFSQWDISPSMLLLNHYKTQFEGSGKLEDDSEGGLFEGCLSLLLRLEQDLINTLANAIMLEVKAKSRPYRKDNWSSMSKEDVESSSLTPSACPMYQVLAEKLHQMNEKLAPKLFQQLWKSVAMQLNTYLFEELLLENAFSSFGGKVLERDVMKCLLPLFQQYTPSSSSYFALLKEACSILSLANIPLAIKKAAIIGTNFELFSSLPVSLKNLTNEEIALVIKRRADTTTNLM